MTKQALPLMRASDGGRIITVSSMNALVPLPFADAYNASKAAVEAFIEGLAPVAATFGVQLVLVEPSAVRTPFFANTRPVGAVGGADDPYAPLLAARAANMGAAVSTAQDPDEVGAAIAHIARVDQPVLRYQRSETGAKMAAAKLADPTGQTIQSFTAAMLESPQGTD